MSTVIEGINEEFAERMEFEGSLNNIYMSRNKMRNLG